MKPILIVLLLCSPCFAQRLPLSKPEPTHAQIVVVECEWDGVNHGSGILIDSQRCLTAMHVIRNDSVKVVYKNAEYIADVVKVHYRNDWALVKTREATDAKPVAIRSRKLGQNEGVIAYGYGGETDRQRKRCFYWSSVFNGKQLQGTQPIPCDSGGPIFDTKGHLVSIVCDYIDGTNLWNGYGLTTDGELERFCE